MKKEKNSYLEVALKKRFCFFHHKVVSNSFLRFNLICKACRKDCCKFLYKVLCLWLFGNVLLLVKDSNLITFLNGFCPNQLTVFLVYRGPCNPVAHHCTENWSFLGRLLMRIWTVVKMSLGWHWCPTLRYNRNRWGRKDVVQLQLDCILQKKHQRRDETALPQSYLSSVHLWNSWKLNTDVQRPKSMAELQACLMSWGFRKELSLDKREEKHCEAFPLALWWFLHYMFSSSSVYSHHLPDHHINPSCSYRPCGWGCLEIPEERLGCVSSNVLLRLFDSRTSELILWGFICSVKVLLDACLKCQHCAVAFLPMCEQWHHWKVTEYPVL